MRTACVRGRAASITTMITRVLIGLVVLAAVMTLLTTCKPIQYYLQQVYKVYGHVTVAGTGTTTTPATPLGSVEVFAGDTQYSELTNYNGDYEMEMAEGTWTIKFVKEGHEWVPGQPNQVTVGPTARRVKLDAEMAPIAPSIDLTGYWYLLFTLGAGKPVDANMYLLQEDSSLNGCLGFAGTIVGSAVTLNIVDPDGNSLLFTGMAQGSDKVIGTTSSGVETGAFEMNRLTGLSFGSLHLFGAVREDFDKALAKKYVPGVSDQEGMLYLDENLQVRLDLGGHTELAAGLLIVYPDPRFDVRFGYVDDRVGGLVIDHEPAQSGWLKIDINEENVQLKGSFSVTLFDGSALWGDFDVVPCF